VAHLRSARGMIEFICTQERWKPEVAIICGKATRYCIAGLQVAAEIMMRIRITQRCIHGGCSPPLRLCGELFFDIALHGPWTSSVRNYASFFVYLVDARFSCGGDASIFLSGPVEARRGIYVAASTDWLFWNIVAHPHLNEGHSSLPPRWL
jgi:hypothetical protein